MRILLARVGTLLVAALLAGCGGGSGAAEPGPAAPPAPTAVTLAQVSPPAADLAGGVTVNVLGTGFLAGPGPLFVHFGSRVAAATVVDDTLLQAVVPPGDQAALVDVRVASPHGFALLVQGFRYLEPPPPAPVLTCVPVVGSWSAALGGTRIDLHVQHLPPLTAPGVTIGGLPAPNLVRLDAQSVRVELPSGLPPGQAAEVVLSDGPRTVSTWSLTVQADLAPGSLSINEFLPEPGTFDANRDGTLSSAGDEFVELVNSTGAVVDLTGFTLSDGTSVRHTFPNPTTVPPGGSIVVFGSGNPTYFAARHASGHAQLAATGTLGLNNSAESILLRDPAGTTIAQANYVGADVQAGRSRNASADGQVLPVPATSSGYVFHDLAAGAAGTLSPGVKVTGASFP
jgi:hypothetical protein